MIFKLKDIINCPICKSELIYSEDKENFYCPEHGEVQNSNDILCFLGRKDFNNFDEHWDSNLTKEIPKKKIEGANNFLQPLFNYVDGLEKEPYILDAGCGDGVHLRGIDENIREEKLWVGVDISLSALRNAKSRLTDDNEQYYFINSDVSNLPFKNKQFDIVYSYGVLAYTNNFFKSFSELCRVTKNNGLIGVYVFPKKKGISGFVFEFVRKICKMAGHKGTSLIANFIVPFLGLLPTSSKLSLKNASWKQCKEIVMVNIAPKNLYFPTIEEVESCFLKNKIKIIIKDQSNPIIIWGKKQMGGNLC